MLANYLKISFRNLLRQKSYALINIFGLAIGIACCILIYLFVEDELTYDSFHEKKERIYCATRQITPPGGRPGIIGGVGIPAGPEFKNAFPEVVECVRLWRHRDVVSYDGTSRGENLTFVDPAFFAVFTFPLAAGDVQTVLSGPDALVLTESAAAQYFGSDDPLGRVLSIKLGQEFHPFTVCGVARDLPQNSSIRFKFLLPLERVRDIRGDAFFTSRRGAGNSSTFLLLDRERPAHILATKLNTLMPEYMDTTVFRYQAQQLTSLHFNEANLLVAAGVRDPVYSYILTGLGVLVLLMACFNFVNLAVARSSHRAREIGIRKVAGAHRAQLVRQFWSEALVLSALALLAGIVMAELLLPTFNSLAGKKLRLEMITDLNTLLVLGGLCLLTALLAGIYPALILSGLRPVEVLKNRFRIGGANILTRSLIVVQFSLSIFLLLGTMIIDRQLNYMKSKDMGFDDQLLLSVFSDTGREEQIFAQYKNEITRHPRVLGVTSTDAAISGSHLRSCSITRGDTTRSISTFKIDHDYLSTVGLSLCQGRNFSGDIPADKINAALINETLARTLGEINPVGCEINLCLQEEPHTVIGVVQDFHYLSMRHEIQPVAFHSDDSCPPRYLNVRISPDSISSTLTYLSDSWQIIAPDLPFEYHFVGEWMDQVYGIEERWRSIIGYSSVLAMIIAALGLFGLSALSTAKRAKEISIRKIHGASVTSILGLVTREFILLGGLAALIAWPPAYWAMNRWLEDFAYRTTIGFEVFLYSGVLMLAVALVSILYQAGKVALANPVDSLRHE